MIVCHSLDLPGGIERAIVNTANMLVEHEQQVTLLILDDSNELFYPLDQRVKTLQFPFHLGITEQGNAVTRKISLFRQILQLRRIIKGITPDFVIGTDASLTVAVYLACWGRPFKVMAWEHHHALHFVRSAFWRSMINYVYPRLNVVITLNEEEAGYFHQRKCSTCCIPNFVEMFSPVKERIPQKRLLTVGWLSETKGMDRLTEVAKIVKLHHPEWEWLVVGDGDLKAVISKEITQHNLENFVKLISPQSYRMDDVYDSAELLVMLSRKECLPMVLLEAHAGGLPCVAFDCPTGPRHIIAHEKSGLLVEPGNTEAMAKAICRLIENEELRIKMRAGAVQIASRFNKESVWRLWLKLLHRG